MLVKDDGTLAGLAFDLQSDAQRALCAERRLTKDQFSQWLQDHYTLYGVMIESALRGVIGVGRGTLHVAVHPSIKGRWLRDLEWVLRRVLLCRPMWVQTDAEDKAACAFIERAGGVPLDANGRVKRYSIELQKMWFMRSKGYERNC